MASNDIWLNLPVKNVQKSAEFFKKIGFTLNSGFPVSDDSASFMIGDKQIVLMLFAEASFERFTQTKTADTKAGSEVLFSIGAKTKEEVDNYAKNAEAAGGTVFGKPSDNAGWMYGCGFTDLDGHRWNALYMDMSKMPK